MIRFTPRSRRPFGLIVPFALVPGSFENSGQLCSLHKIALLERLIGELRQCAVRAHSVIVDASRLSGSSRLRWRSSCGLRRLGQSRYRARSERRTRCNAQQRFTYEVHRYPLPVLNGAGVVIPPSHSQSLLDTERVVAETGVAVGTVVVRIVNGVKRRQCVEEVLDAELNRKIREQTYTGLSETVTAEDCVVCLRGNRERALGVGVTRTARLEGCRTTRRPNLSVISVVGRCPTQGQLPVLPTEDEVGLGLPLPALVGKARVLEERRADRVLALV